MWYPFKRKIEHHMTSAIIGSIIRHALTIFGGAGLISGSDSEQLASAASIIVSVVWSIIQKKSQHEKVSTLTKLNSEF